MNYSPIQGLQLDASAETDSDANHQPAAFEMPDLSSVRRNRYKHFRNTIVS